ncbi:D-galactarate dehydratase [Octadecabacter sp. R77987]|uniref:D-galactarate dehydratase n=1 Tax=Octadecabacter sp. R77987 TaxID=3093874 RepID=UPI00366E3A02
MKKLVPVLALFLGACSSPSLQGIFAPPGDGAVDAAAADAAAAITDPEPVTLDPTPPPPPPPTARTVDQFDTTTAENRAEALAAPVEPAGERALGSTIASLGSPTDPGIWLKTPLVSEVTAGRVAYPVNGKSVNVELRPSGGAVGSGSQISLAAMRLLEAPLTGLPELLVFAN